MPDGSPGIGPCDVIFFGAEDDLEDTLRPRFKAAGADLRRVNILVAIRDGEGKEYDIKLPDSIDQIEEAIEETRAGAVCIDPIMAFFGTGNSNKDDEVRRTATTPLKVIAERTRAAIIGIRHFSKDKSKSAIHRGMGSVAFTAAARSVLISGQHPDDD